MALLLPYKKASKSAKTLANTLGVKRIKIDNLNVDRLQRAQWVINWGNSTYPIIPHVRYYNHPKSVQTASNKLSAFQVLDGDGVKIPKYTSLIQIAEEWQRRGFDVVERHKLTGHSAEGLVIKRYDQPLDKAPLYVQYMKKTDEYRVHVFHGTVIHVQRKARKLDVADEHVNWRVRNLANGFIYMLNLDREVPQCVLDQATKAIHALDLDFGAVDVIYHKETGATVLEVNTACGLEGTTLEKYTEAFSAALQGLKVPEWIQPQGVLQDNPVQAQPEAPEVEGKDDPDPEPEEFIHEIDELEDMDDDFVPDLQIVAFKDAVQEVVDMPDEKLRENMELILESVVKINTRLLKL